MQMQKRLNMITSKIILSLVVLDYSSIVAADLSKPFLFSPSLRLSGESVHSYSLLKEIGETLCSTGDNMKGPN